MLTALAVSGLPVDRFCFEGFPPRRPGERARAFAGLAAEPRTLVFFEAPHRLAQTLADLAAAFGADRPAAVCRELTKTWEQVRRGGLAELAAWAAEGVKGEITVVVQGCAPGGAPPAAQRGVVLAEVVRGIPDRVAAGERLKDVCADLAARTGLSRKEIYDAAIAARRDPTAPV